MAAQDAPTGAMLPPKVLVIEREYTKPGKGGAPHEKSESAFVSALAAAKWPTHYLAATSMSGRPRALFMFGYPTFEAWEKDNLAYEKNPALSAVLDRDNVVDGELLDEVQQSVYLYDPELSLHVGDAVHSRYFDITHYKIKPGHRAEWEELVKLYQSGFAKVPNANWALYESYYGEDNGGIYLAISRMTSLSEDDASLNDDKKFEAAMGPEGMKKVRELSASCVDSVQDNLFAFSPKMSYPAEEWIKADPFWKPKPDAAAKPAMAAMPGMAAKKPAAAAKQ
ncbi:MAG: hypothetical protein ACLQM6_06060 [Acidobacteriaceae bacterium]